MWTVETVLADHPECPVCGGVERRPSELEAGKTGFYIRGMLESGGLDVDEVTGRLRLWECGACRTLWYDPWLTTDFVSSAYGYTVGRHKFGWASLRAWATGQSRPYFVGRPRLLDLLLALRPGMTRYAEVNCPFAGLFFELTERRHHDLDRGLVFSKMEVLRDMYATPGLKRDYAEPEAWAKVRLPAPDGPLAAVRRVLVEEQSPQCWGRSCTLAGANCHAMARDFLVDAVTDFHSLGRVDVIGFFNTLDHFPDPTAVLNKALDHGDVVVADLHAWQWTDAQHHYNVGTGFAEVLAARKVSVVDVSSYVAEDGRLGDNSRYFLMSRTLDLAGETAKLSQDNLCFEGLAGR